MDDFVNCCLTGCIIWLVLTMFLLGVVLAIGYIIALLTVS